jgi:hypothetical protein
MRIYLIHLINKFNYGGSTTYLIHLYEQMKSLGYEPVIIKRGKKDRVGSYYHIPVFFYDDEKILYIAKNNKSIITYCFWSENGDLAKRLLRLNVPMVLHDPSEFNDEWLPIAKKLNNTIVIREKNKNNLKEYGIESTFIPHPYITKEIDTKKNKLAVCPARIDFRKHTDIVCEYNNEAENPIHIYGEINRMFDYHKLTPTYPNWKWNYYGVIPAIFHEQIKVISKYEYSIDLTAIKKDGGGTQYCFFEAWNSNCILILNKKWDCENSTLKDKINCIFINDAKELKYVLDNKISYDIYEARKILNNHSADNIIPQYINIIQ